MSTQAEDAASQVPAPSATGAAPHDDSAERADHSRSTWLAGLILAAVLVVHVGFVRHDVQARHALDHDEVISQVAATGHFDAWHRLQLGEEPANTWVTGADLRRYTEVDGETTLGGVSSGVADLDIHPPLYYWTLLGFRTVGFGPLWSGALLNLAAVVLTGALLYFLLVKALRDRVLAALAVAVFAFSPALVRSVAFARQYPLLMLLGVALIAATSGVVQRPRSPWRLALLFVIGLLGVLVAHEFALALAGAVVVVAARWWRSWRNVVPACAAAVASGLAALAIFPALVDQFERVRDRAAANPPTSLESRTRTWVQGFLDLVTLDRVDATFEVLAVIGGLVLLATSPWWLRPALRLARRRVVVAASIGVAGVPLLGATAAFLLGTSPPHAFGWQYLIMFWPAIVLVGAVVAQRNLRRPVLALLITAAILGAFTARWERDIARATKGQRYAVHQMSDATIVIADCADSGYVPGAGMWLSPRAHVLVPSPGAVSLPPIPRDADRSRPVLLDVKTNCNWRVRDPDRLLARLGYERGPRIGTLGQVGGFSAYQLLPIPATRSQ